jgi:hypothetical protein
MSDAASLSPLTPLLLNEVQARKVLGGISRATLFNYRRLGLPFIKLPGRVMFEPSALKEWIAGHRVVEVAT